jgi:hypothetical protein
VSSWTGLNNWTVDSGQWTVDTGPYLIDCADATTPLQTLVWFHNLASRTLPFPRLKLGRYGGGYVNA